MPDDIKEEIQVAEPENVEENSGFDAFLNEPEKKEEKKSEEEETSEEGKEEEKSEEEKKEDPKEEEKKEEEETDEDKAVRERLEKAAEAYKDDDETPPPVVKGKEEASPASSSVTKEVVNDMLNYLKDEDLPLSEVIIGDDTIDLGKLKSEDPEVFNATKIIAVAAADKMVRDMMQRGGFVKADAMQKLEQKVSDLAFWDGIRDVHEDAKRIARSEEFFAWKAKQPKSVQKLMDNATVESAIDCMTLFKKDVAKSKVKEHDDKKRNEKKEKDDLHKNSMRDKASEEGKDKVKSNESDEDAGFNSYFKKK